VRGLFYLQRLRTPSRTLENPASTPHLAKRGEPIMSVKLNQRAFEFAKELIKEGLFVYDDRDAWSEHQPSAQEENEFIRQYGMGEYAKWHLGIDDAEDEDRKGRYKFPYGDFRKVHRCGVLAAESRAGQYKHFDIEVAAAHLHGMIEAKHA
jgi:hypothetical protein